MHTRIAAVDPQHPDLEAAGVLLDEFGPPRIGLDGGDTGAGLEAEGGQQRGLAARPGTQIQPAALVAVDRRQRQRLGHQLAALVLHQRLAVAHRREPARVTAGQINAVGRIAGGRAAHLFG